MHALTIIALEVLEAGASVAQVCVLQLPLQNTDRLINKQVYTALVYGGVGTIARIKDEMRDEIKTARQEGRS